MEENEEWKDVVGYEGLYQVSSLGRVKSFHSWRGKKERIINPFPNRDGYRKVDLRTSDGKRKTKSVHTLVLEAFAGEQPPEMQCNHKDGIKSNNRLENLEYCTRCENVLHTYRNLGRVPMRGERHGLSKLTEKEVLEMRHLHSIGRYNYKELGEVFKVSQVTARRIIIRMVWKHI